MTDQPPQIDAERKAKVFEIAKGMKKSCYMLTVAYQDNDWLVVCNAKIGGTLYQSANTIDAFSVAQHVDLFRLAFSEALKEYEKKEKKIITLH